MRALICYNRIMYKVECWIENAVHSLDFLFTYGSEVPIERGIRCYVPFGNFPRRMAFVDHSEEYDGTIEELSQELGYQVKEIEQILDEEPVLNEELYELALWLKERTLSTTIACFQVMMTNKKRVKGKWKSVVLEQIVEIGDTSLSLTPKQSQCVEYVREHPSILYTNLRKQYPSIVKTLMDKAVLVKKSRERLSFLQADKEVEALYPLNDEQERAYRLIQKKEGVHLLYGQTGSGKTEVYLHLAKDVIQDDKQVLILVPEIGLTPQMIQRVSRFFGQQLGVYHSGLNEQERYEQYQLVKQGALKVIVGTRSAIFLPFQNLGLIVLDEEHDPSYKQDVQPSYHCRDVAIERAKIHHCPVVLGSATPALESYAKALKAVYQLVPLKNRFGQEMAQVNLVDMSQEIRKGKDYILSDDLKQSLKEVFKKKEQAILLLNKRGYNRLLRCKSCQEVLTCPHCDLALSYHSDSRKMKCHSCGFEMMIPRRCPHCYSEDGFSGYGFGTQRLCERIQEEFPEAKLLRMDFDSTQRKNAHKEILETFGEQKADILVGTQMIAKGLDFPNVTLVGVINADDGLQRSDYRSSEYTFNLLMQAAGRSGRGAKKGKVIFQVYNPNHFAIQSAIQQDYESFFRQEMKYRHLAKYPPYTSFISFVFEGKKEEKVRRLVEKFNYEISQICFSLGIAALLKKQDLYRYRIVVKEKYLDDLLEKLKSFLEQTDLKLQGMKIDVNPLYLE